MTIFIILIFPTLLSAKTVTKKNLKYEFDKKVTLKSILKVNVKGNLPTTKLGDNEYTVTYKKNKYIIKYTVVDTTSPIILGGTTKTTTVGKKINLVNKYLCGDNHDSRPKCYIKGNYDINTPGTYKLKYIAEDSSGNKTTKNIKLKVKEKKTSGSSSTSTTTKVKRTKISTYIKKYTTEAGNTYADDAVNRLYSAAGYRTLDSSNNVEYFMGNMKFNINWSGTTPTATCQMTEDGGKTYGEAQPVTNPTSNGATPPVYTFTYKKVIATDESGNPTDEKPYTFTITKPDPTHKPKEVLIDVSLEEKVDTAKCLLEGFMGHITEFWNAFNSDFASSNADFTSARQTYVDSANELANIIYGSGAPSYSVSSIAGPPDISALDDISTMYNKQGQDSYKNFDNSFYKIYMNIVLDNIMNTYGEPKTAWINMNDQNDNGEAKAQWYTNLYNRIYQCGYSVLKDGLASSEDWIKYAFESGIVTMEQVDSYNEWNQLNYNNCSDITEQTDTRAVTIAEAEYNAAMNKIENKDKRYDLELKNIDTEHNSLQTEYDSIKAAMDKNIERTFKLYG